MIAGPGLIIEICTFFCNKTVSYGNKPLRLQFNYLFRSPYRVDVYFRVFLSKNIHLIIDIQVLYVMIYGRRIAMAPR